MPAQPPRRLVVTRQPAVATTARWHRAVHQVPVVGVTTNSLPTDAVNGWLWHYMICGAGSQPAATVTPARPQQFRRSHPHHVPVNVAHYIPYGVDDGVVVNRCVLPDVWAGYEERDQPDEVIDARAPRAVTLFDKRRFSRRGFLGAGIASGFALAACASAYGIRRRRDDRCNRRGRGGPGRTVGERLPPRWPPGRRGRPGGADRQYADLRQHHPRPLIRATVGDEIVVSVTNRLGDPTSGALARHRAAQRYGWHRARDCEHHLYVPVPRAGSGHLLGPSARRSSRDHGLYRLSSSTIRFEPGFNYDAEWITIP